MLMRAIISGSWYRISEWLTLRLAFTVPLILYLLTHSHEAYSLEIVLSNMGSVKTKRLPSPITPVLSA
jgi:hypothetical protein